MVPRSILITDSGLGGLSICARAVEGLARGGAPGRTVVTYFNARPEQDGSYSQMPGAVERARVFDQALLGMARFRPDLLVIACNTLSALYPRTAFSRTSPIPVLEIIDFGVRMIHQRLRAQPESRVILLGSPVTIEEGTHAARLAALGVAPGRIVAQPCPGLALEIETDPAGPAVRDLVDRCLAQAAARIQDCRQPVLAALCCTHYGYSLPAFQRALAAHFTGGAEVLDPNQAMAAHLCPPPGRGEARVELEVVSKVRWSEQKVAAISAALEPVSRLTAQALRDYRLDPELFSS